LVDISGQNVMNAKSIGSELQDQNRWFLGFPRVWMRWTGRSGKTFTKSTESVIWLRAIGSNTHEMLIWGQDGRTISQIGDLYLDTVHLLGLEQLAYRLKRPWSIRNTIQNYLDHSERNLDRPQEIKMRVKCDYWKGMIYLTHNWDPRNEPTNPEIQRIHFILSNIHWSGRYASIMRKVNPFFMPISRRYTRRIARSWRLCSAFIYVLINVS
jgi:hypothetical protein